MGKMTSNQARNQWLAWYVAHDEELDDELTLALFEAVWAESNWRNYANPKVPVSLTHPHDAVGFDHDSVGVLQQRVTASGGSKGWGDYKSAMNPEKAMRVFLARAKGSPMRGKGAHRVAQNVQRSAFSDGRNYKAKEQKAQAMIDRMKISCASN